MQEPTGDAMITIASDRLSWRRRFSHGQHDAHHQLQTGKFLPSAPTFFQQAEQCLRSIAADVVSDLAESLHQFPGRWNPLGFLVWHLGVDAAGNSLRLHAWPSIGRKVATFHPGVHCHAWYLSSYMLAGGYCDVHYNVIEHGYHSEEERTRLGYLRKFSLEYLGDGTSSLVNRGECVSLAVRDARLVEPGQMHHIKDGVFHATSIPAAVDAVTLVLDSPCLGYNTTTVLDCEQDFPTRGRPDVTPLETRHVQGVLRGLSLK